MSYHKFNESQREQLVLRRLKQGEIVALISDAGTPGISDPGMELVSMLLFLCLFTLINTSICFITLCVMIFMQAKLCVGENVPVVPIPGPCALVSALSASGLSTDEFTFGN
jgi:16S rRNA (cytidine1402-2'-O)-methyltransferase